MATVILFMCLSACSSTASGNPEMRFSDVPAGEVWGEAIAYVSADGYMVGKGSDIFDPESPITRTEVAVVMLRAKHGTDFTPAQSEGDWWTSWVNEAEAEGLMEAVMTPDAPATRADIATLMWLLAQ